MTPDQIRSVRSTVAKLLPVKARAADLFYDRLFETAPRLQPIFKGDAAAQGARMMAAIEVVGAGLDRLETIVPPLQALGREHAGHGVAEADYEIMGETLLWTLEQTLGAAFTAEAKAAWVEAYGLACEAMIAAARKVPERCVARSAA